MYPPHHYGGYELVWRSAVEHLREQGHDVRVLTTDTRTESAEPGPPGIYRDLRWHLRDAQFQRLTLIERVKMARHNHAHLDRHLDEFRPDVVGWWSMGGLNLTMLETVRRRGVPAIAFVHDDWLDYGTRADPWLSLFRGRRAPAALPAGAVTGLPTSVDFDGAAQWLFGSERTRRHAAGLGHGLQHTAVAQLGIDTVFLDAEPPREWAWRLLYVGRLDPRKGIDTAVEALRHLPDEAELELIGGWDSREEKRLRDLAVDHGVADRVRFAGHLGRQEIAAAYGRTDATIFPVRWEEPWGLVPLEAMGKGRPVVATGRGGSSEYLRDEENCLLFEADDPIALAAALKRLANDESLRTRLREPGLETAATYTEAKYNARIERALQEAGSEAHRESAGTGNVDRANRARGATDEDARFMSLLRRMLLRLRRLPISLGYYRGPVWASNVRKLWVRARNPGADIRFGNHTYLGPGFSLHMPHGGTFVTGEFVEFRRNFRAELAGPDSSIRFGARSVCTYDVLIQCGTTIDIGERCMFGQSTIIVDGNHRFRDLDRPMLDQGYDFGPIRIGDDATITSKCSIIADVGTRAFVGANAVVTRPIPPFTVAGGVPARPIDYFGPPGSEPDSPSAKSSRTSG